ncbi:MAG TPA: sugar phosphate nucleotidyltransferase [Acidimicrobiia bacterium]|nr:sugar phosphate nucleotidyltransferase [Acidimicrobiia bacterium]
MRRSVAVLAGGLGTRVGHLTGADTPKAMLPIGDRPFIDFKLAELAAAGADEIVLLTGFGTDALRTHVEAEGPARVPVRVVEDGPHLLGTGGAIRRALDLLPDPFWVTYGDTLLDVDLDPAQQRLTGHAGLEGVMTVLRNEDRRGVSNVSIDAELIVTAYEKDAAPGSHAYIDYGMLLLRRAAFAHRDAAAAFDLTDVLGAAVGERRLAAFVVREPFHDIGTESAWHETARWALDTRLWERLQERIGRRAAFRGLPRP